MKKLAILLMFIGFGFGLNAQTLKYSETYYKNDSYNLSDTTTATDSTKTRVVQKLTDARLYPKIVIGLDSVSGTGSIVQVILYKRQMQYQNYEAVDSISWSGNTTTYNNSDADTIFTFDVTSASKEEDWKVVYTSADNAFIWKRNFEYFKFEK